jgi:hypothetical protein
VVSNNLPVITAITAYSTGESFNANQQAPLFAPYDNLTEAWWDNLVSEQLHARLPVIMLSTCGSQTTNPADMTGPGNLNPRRLQRWVAAIQRAGATSQFKVGCFVEGAAQSIYYHYYGLPSTTLYDFSNTDAWDKVWWQRIIKPWFDTVPSSYWYQLNGKVPVEFWGLNINTIYTNQQGNISQFFTWLDAQIFATYGVHAGFIMGSVNCDTTLATCASFVGDNEWFGAPAGPYSMTAYKGKTWGGLVAGYTNPAYFDSSSPNFHNPNVVIPRNGVGGTGVLGDTLKAGLNAAVSTNAILSIIEGYTDTSEACGLYRSTNTAWSYPNQYLDIIRSYTDLRTTTSKLEAEAADEYGDTTTGNSGGSFLRSPEDLDVRALTGAPSASASSVFTTAVAANAFDGDIGSKWITTTSAPGWLQYDYGAGNKNVVNGYYLTSANNNPTSDPASWQFQGSNDGTSWTTLDTRTGQVFAARAQTNEYNFTNTTAYQYYRLNVSACAGTGGIQVAELLFKRANSTGGGWAVTNTAAGEWIQFDGLSFSAGNYKFPICYSSTAAHTVRLLVDGVALTDVSLPSSGGMNTFTTAYLGTKTLTHGTHTLRVYFVDGGVDVDWIFAKKYDSMLSLHASTGYISAELGGNSTITAAKTSIGSWEKFSANDVNGGTLSANDVVSLQVYDGLYLTATGGGGGTLTASVRTPGTNEQFTLVKTVGSGAIANGDTVALKSANNHYVTVVSGSVVDVSATTIGAAQTFTATLGSQ